MIELIQAVSTKEIDEVRILFKEYEQSLGISLCFQNFEQELKDLPGDYASPRGALLLAKVDSASAGCCALRPQDKAPYSNAAEMKRLYVRPESRGKGLGARLVMSILNKAKDLGYACVILDTLKTMEDAQALYASLGFMEIPPYYDSPMEGTKYLKLDLQSASFFQQ